ncbi:hypothetical protein J2S43_006615 [Catenuloplanes nepalensis]|uniref:Uncharacterized protein n=1 Tax=Catenuloplanes nepalensis TaxID=587533 RepID=A0ABT9N327_9ACTN|nr:hypothetical protein [Catenuloplanes nepalensis]MDP9798103.1 hypothetical protein [Catenuloplanes nepalensis]
MTQTQVSPWWRRRGVLPAAVTAWVLVIAGLAYYSYRTDAATVRDHRPLDRAMPVADTAYGTVLAKLAEGPGDGGVRPVIVLEPPRVEPGCRVTTARDGAELTRRATVHIAPEDGVPLIERLAGAGALPAGYRIWLGRDRDGATNSFRVDAGDFIGLRGIVEEPGLLRVSLETGCRPVDGPLPAVGQPAPDFMSAGRAEGVLAALGAPGSRQSASSVPCPGGGALTTTLVAGFPERAPALTEVLTPRAGLVLTSGEKRFAYTDGGREGVAVEVADGGEITVAATTSC